MRAGEAMEAGLRECCRSVRIGKILIQRVGEAFTRVSNILLTWPAITGRRDGYAKTVCAYIWQSYSSLTVELVQLLLKNARRHRRAVGASTRSNAR